MTYQRSYFGFSSKSPVRNTLSLLISIAILANAGVSNVHAATNEWLGIISSEWSDPNNWSLAILPDSNINALVDSGNLILDTTGASWNLAMGVSSGSDASITVNNGNQWTLGKPLSGSSANGFKQHIGELGKATLTIKDGGKLFYAANSTTILGDQAGSEGEVIVSGADSVWSSIYADASHSSNQTNIQIGNYGAGKISVLDGASVITPRGISMAQEVGSSGSILVSGTGSTMLLGNSSLGNTGWAGIFMIYGEADVTVEDGGDLTLYGGIFFGRGKNGAAQNLTIRGTGSTITSYGDISNVESGIIRIEDGAKLYTLHSAGTDFATQGQGIVGRGGGSNIGDAYAYVTGNNSLWHMDQDAIVGYLANGHLIISDGATVENARGRIALKAGYTGTVTVSDVGSIWNNSGNVTVGSVGNGALTVSNGGVVNVGNSLLIAEFVGSTGALNFGSAEHQAATATGTINANQISFGAGEGRVVFNHNDTHYQFDHLLSGTGTVVADNGLTQFSNHQTYAGQTEVHNGAILKAGIDNAFSANSSYDISSGGILDLAGYQQTIGTTTNAGLIKFHTAAVTSAQANNLLTIDGDLHSNDGEIIFNTVLGDDNSATDKLVVNGNTSGTAWVSVLNAGGSGAAALNGIQLVQVNGNSDGEFVKNGRIVAGAFDYSLVRGAGANISNWYLTNTISTDTEPDPDSEVARVPGPSIMIERPEASSYSANLAAANNMFVTRLHDRLGETQYIDALTGEQKVTSMWLRNEGGHNRSRDARDQLGTQSNRYVLQLGGDIAQWSHNDLDRLHLGVMGGYGTSKSKTESRISGYSARASVDGYSLGVYGTWYANEADKSGLYVDSWAQYSWFNNSVDGQYLHTEEYKSKGVTASIESGYTFNVGENTAKNATYFIQPKAQVTWMGVKADDHQEANGTRVSGVGEGNIQTRLGVKAFMNGFHESDKGKDRVFQPFVEANWLHNTKDFGTQMDGITVKQAGARNIGELKAGVEGQINKQLNIWGNVGQQIGGKGYSDTAVMLGVKYNF
ncbi:autotransporter outer membrane beta-barrel domain-containing protein [Yersinia frederiksenii]|uniref:autotransporter outer membrane beta-barrel domain-containing protein n=1 Tax=Yersinia frederiksenii TaxID=29484 RepID=UPI0011AA4697|nr:autotransporter outer membrane beta-barrel domain-containing protein [Yersinia frederiksenii]